MAPVEQPVALEPPWAEGILVPRSGLELHFALVGLPHFPLHYERGLPLYPLAGARVMIQTLGMNARRRHRRLLEP